MNILTLLRRVGVASGVLCLCQLAFQNASAEEPVVGRVFVMGDSLSDGGAYSELSRSLGLPATTFYRSTNNLPDGSALTASEYFGGFNGIAFTPNVINDEVAVTGAGIAPYTDGGFNFAESGARVDLPNPAAAALGPLVTAKSFLAQIPDAISLAGGRFSDNDVITITIGANDFFNANPATAVDDLSLAAAQLADGVR